MAEKNIQLKDKSGVLLYPKTKVGIVDGFDKAVETLAGKKITEALAGLSQAMVLRGPIDTAHPLPVKFLDVTKPELGGVKAGDTFVCAEDGYAPTFILEGETTAASHKLDAGDTVVCVPTTDSAPHFAVIQANLTNAVQESTPMTSGKLVTATGAKSVGSLATSIGAANKGVYLSAGELKACTYEVNASVPAGAKFTDTTYGVVTTSANGLMIAADKKKLDGYAATFAANPAASTTAAGLLKLGYAQTGKNYPVNVSTDGKAYVNVPWTDTKYTLPEATGTVLGGVKLGGGINEPGEWQAGLEVDEAGRAYVDIFDTIPLATDANNPEKRGLVTADQANAATAAKGWANNSFIHSVSEDILVNRKTSIGFSICHGYVSNTSICVAAPAGSLGSIVINAATGGANGMAGLMSVADKDKVEKLGNVSELQYDVL